MPCQTVTVPGTGSANLSASNIDVNESEGQATVTGTVTNSGNISGASDVVFTVDVGNTGTTDNSVTESAVVSANDSVTLQKTFQIDNLTQTDVKFCFELAS